MADVPVLCFHKITRDHEWGVTTYSPQWFEELLSLLKERGFQFSSVEEAPHRTKPIVITFDDGYESVIKNALPIMEKYNSPFIVFPVINYIGQLNEWDANIGGIKFRHLNEEQLRLCLKKNGHIGSHSLNHKAFSLISADKRMDEIEKSFAYLKEKFDISRRYFAAPFGEKLDQDLIKKCHIEFSFQLDGKNWDGQRNLISRIPVYRFESPHSVLRKIDFPARYGWISRFIRFGARATVFAQRFMRA